MSANFPLYCIVLYCLHLANTAESVVKNANRHQNRTTFLLDHSQSLHKNFVNICWQLLDLYCIEKDKWLTIVKHSENYKIRNISKLGIHKKLLDIIISTTHLQPRVLKRLVNIIATAKLHLQKLAYQTNSCNIYSITQSDQYSRCNNFHKMGITTLYKNLKRSRFF